MFASTSRVNIIQESVKYQHGKAEIGMPVFMVCIAAVGKAGDIRKEMQNCRRMEIEKKMMYGLKKTKYDHHHRKETRKSNRRKSK